MPAPDRPMGPIFMHSDALGDDGKTTRLYEAALGAEPRAEFDMLTLPKEARRRRREFWTPRMAWLAAQSEARYAVSTRVPRYPLLGVEIGEFRGITLTASTPPAATPAPPPAP